VLPTVRAVSLTNYIDVARFIGLDPYAMLRRARIAPDLLSDPESRVPAAAAVALLTISAQQSGCHAFGLLLAECRTFASLGPVSLVMAHQPNMRAMVESLSRFQRHMNDIQEIQLRDDGEHAEIDCCLPPEFAQRQAVELAVGVFYRALSEVSRGRWRPESIHFVHSGPDDLRVHRRVFGSRIEFDSSFNGMCCPSAALDIPNPAADPVMAHNAAHLLSMVPTNEPGGSAAERARHVISMLIPSGQTSMERVADNLGVHPRTLQRMLDKEGQTYAGLLNETRRELAQRYLTRSHHSIASIAHLAGYSNQSAFTRWFAAEFGQSPAAWRAHQPDR
jgi:AraC-like DNA-binding protein